VETTLKLNNGVFMPSEWKVELGALGIEKHGKLLLLVDQKWELSDWDEPILVNYDGEELVFRI
jgi:hypothetical protein